MDRCKASGNQLVHGSHLRPISGDISECVTELIGLACLPKPLTRPPRGYQRDDLEEVFARCAEGLLKNMAPRRALRPCFAVQGKETNQLYKEPPCRLGPMDKQYFVGKISISGYG